MGTLATATMAVLLAVLCAFTALPVLSQTRENVLAGLSAGDAAALGPFLSDITASLPQDESSKQAALCKIIADKQLPIVPSFCTPPPAVSPPPAPNASPPPPPPSPITVPAPIPAPVLSPVPVPVAPVPIAPTPIPAPAPVPAPAPTCGPVTLVNGDFSANLGERPTVPIGWEVEYASAGSNYAFGPGQGFFFGALSDDVVSQVVTLVPGCTYHLSYTFQSSGDNTNDFNPAVNGSPLLDANGNSLSLLNPPAEGNVPYVGVFTATLVETTISFGGYDIEDYSHLRNVVLSAA